jgi:hypothetical protein
VFGVQETFTQLTGTPVAVPMAFAKIQVKRAGWACTVTAYDAWLSI